ncbi:MAG: hypothetical protein NT013_27370 [Planctomycetia bacterium]|nr:hypothetical protein [Planctomycetia bacterium]
MSTSLTTLLERAAWIGGAVTLAIGAFAIARQLTVRFTGWRPAELSLPISNNLPPPRLPGWFPRFCATRSAEAREPLGQVQVACLLARCVESAVVWLIGLTLVGAGLLNVWWYGVDLDVVPVAQQRHEFVVLAFLAVTITGLALIGVVWRMGLSIVAIGVLLSAYFSLLDQGTISRRPANEADLAACPIEIRMEDGTVGADVWVNGVLLGQTPLTVTLADWMKLPKWLDAPTTGPDGREVLTTRTSRGTRWLTCVVRPDRRWVSASVPEGTYFLWAEIGGEPLVSAHASHANVSFDGVQWMASPILIQGQSPRWLTALDRLLDQARARDYRIESPDEWLAAMHSFGEGGWRQAMRAAESEPLLNDMLVELLQREIGVTAATTQDEAWAIFERLERQATEARDYQSESRIGRSLELLLPHLDPERLARYAAGIVDGLRWVPSARSWGVLRRGEHESVGRALLPVVSHEHESQTDGNARPTFSTGDLTLSHASVDVTHFRRRDQLARLSFLAHAVWRMDELLDRKETDEAGDNVIERLVVSALLRRGAEHADVRQLVMRLGGSLEDQHLQRWFRDWRRRRPGHEFQFGSEFWRMTQGDQSEAARRWRRQHPDEVLSFAESIGFEENQDFYFGLSDADVSTESLAVRFWPKYREHTMSLQGWPPVRKLAAMWRYLFRMEPYSTPEMYVSAWRTSGIELFLASELQLDDSEIATRLSHDKRKAVIAALTAEAQARLNFAQSDEARRRVAELEEQVAKREKMLRHDIALGPDPVAPRNQKEFLETLIAEAQSELKSAQYDISPRRLAELEETLRQIAALERNAFASRTQRALQRFEYFDDKESAFESLADVMTREIPACPELLELLDSPDPKKRLLAARVIRTHPAPHIRPLLEKLLGDADAEVKKIASETQTEWQRLATEEPGKWLRVTDHKKR